MFSQINTAMIYFQSKKIVLKLRHEHLNTAPQYLDLTYHTPRKIKSTSDSKPKYTFTIKIPCYYNIIY